MQRGVNKEATGVEVEVAFGVVVLEDEIGCPKFNSFLKLISTEYNWVQEK